MEDKYLGLFGFTQAEFNNKALEGKISDLVPRLIESGAVVISYDEVPVTRTLSYIFALVKSMISEDDIPAFGGGIDERAAIQSSYIVVPEMKGEYMLGLDALLMSGMKIITQQETGSLQRVVDEGRDIEKRYQPMHYKSLSPLDNTSPRLSGNKRTMPSSAFKGLSSRTMDKSTEVKFDDYSPEEMTQKIGSLSTEEEHVGYSRILDEGNGLIYSPVQTSAREMSARNSIKPITSSVKPTTDSVRNATDSIRSTSTRRNGRLGSPPLSTRSTNSTRGMNNLKTTTPTNSVLPTRNSSSRSTSPTNSVLPTRNSSSRSTSPITTRSTLPTSTRSTSSTNSVLPTRNSSTRSTSPTTIRSTALRPTGSRSIPLRSRKGLSSANLST